MPINSLVKCLFNFWTVMFQKTIHGQFVKNSWTFMFQKTALSPFVFCLFLSFPLSSSLCLFVFLSFCLFLSFSPSLLLSFPLSSSLFLLSFFNVHPALPSNSLKTKDLRKRHFWLQIFESRKTAKTQNVRCKICPMICSLSRRPYTPKAAQNWPYMLRRETLHHVRFYVGFADQTLHTQHRW